MHSLAIASLLGALLASLRQRDAPLSASLAIWAGSDLALTALRGPLDAHDYADPWRYPVTLGLWLLPAVWGVALGCYRLLGRPLLGVFPVGWLLGLLGMVAADPSLNGPPAQRFGGYSLAMMSVAVLVSWGWRRWTPETRRALVVCGIDALAIVGAWPDAFRWITQAQAALCGVVLIAMMWRKR